jgi:hypothetical protein
MEANVKKLPIVLACAAVLRAGAAFAQAGNNLAWNDCVGSGNEVFDRSDECTNGGLRSLIASFVSASDIELATEQWELELQTNSLHRPMVDGQWDLCQSLVLQRRQLHRSHVRGRCLADVSNPDRFGGLCADDI